MKFRGFNTTQEISASGVSPNKSDIYVFLIRKIIANYTN